MTMTLGALQILFKIQTSCSEFEMLQVSVSVLPCCLRASGVRSRPDNTERDTIPLLSTQSPFITVITKHSPEVGTGQG